MNTGVRLLNHFTPPFSLFVLLLVQTGIIRQVYSVPPDNPISSPSESPGGIQIATPQRPLNRLADVEIKSICSFLDQRSISHLLRASHQCQNGVEANDRTGLDTFQKGRSDVLWLHTEGLLERFLTAMDHGAFNHLYTTRIHVTISSEDTIHRFLSNGKLQKTLTSLTLSYLEQVKRNLHKESLPSYLKKFKKLRHLTVPIRNLMDLKQLLSTPSLQNSLKTLTIDFHDVSYNREFKETMTYSLGLFKNLVLVRLTNQYIPEPTLAFSRLMENNINEFKDLILKEPKNLLIINSNHYSLAHLAVQRESMDALKFLIDYAPQSLKMPGYLGTTVLHLATSTGSLEMVKLLAEHAPEMITTQGYRGSTPLHSFDSLCDRNLKVVMYLVNRSPDMLMVQDNDGQTIAHLAVLYEFFDTAKFLIQKESRCLKLRNQEGLTIMDFARRQTPPPLEFIQFLEQLAPAKHIRKKARLLPLLEAGRK